MKHFSKLVFNHNQKKGSNPVVLCITERCNRTISREKSAVLYFPLCFLLFSLF